MAHSPGNWASASECANASRLEVPSTYILRVSEAACADLGIVSPEPDDGLADLHELVRKFADTFKHPEAIDQGTPFASRPGQGLYRIRRGEWRGIVWADKTAGVVWLVAATALGPAHEEDDAYAALATRADDELFPTTSERERAAQAQRIAHTWRALRDAMQEAFELPEQWHRAKLRQAGDRPGEGEEVGRAYIERLELEGDDDEDESYLVDRFLITILRPPAGLDADEWFGGIVARVFPGGGQVLPIGTDDLPAGSNFQPGLEIALAQQD